MFMDAQKYQLRPVVVDALQVELTMERHNVNELAQFAGDDAVRMVPDADGSMAVQVRTAYGVTLLKDGDWVILGPSGSVYVCKKQTFRMVYERWDAPVQNRDRSPGPWCVDGGRLVDLQGGDVLGNAANRPLLELTPMLPNLLKQCLMALVPVQSSAAASAEYQVRLMLTRLGDL